MPFFKAPNQSVRWLVAELLVVVLGILIAFQVDEWRENRTSHQELRQHLLNLHSEINGNIFTLENVMWDLENTKIPALEESILFFNSQEVNGFEPEAQLKTLMESASTTRPWLRQGSYDAFKASESYGQLSEIQDGLILASTYEAYSVLIGQVDILGEKYHAAIQSYMPANLQSEVNNMRNYFLTSSAPRIADIEDEERAVEKIHQDAAQLLPLARIEAAAASGNWYAISRTAQNFYRTREVIETTLSSIYPGWREFSRPSPRLPPGSGRSLRSLEPLNL